jgi:hypothetical protein
MHPRREEVEFALSCQCWKRNRRTARARFSQTHSRVTLDSPNARRPAAGGATGGRSARESAVRRPRHAPVPVTSTSVRRARTPVARSPRPHRSGSEHPIGSAGIPGGRAVANPFARTGPLSPECSWITTARAWSSITTPTRGRAIRVSLAAALRKTMHAGSTSCFPAGTCTVAASGNSIVLSSGNTGSHPAERGLQVVIRTNLGVAHRTSGRSTRPPEAPEALEEREPGATPPPVPRAGRRSGASGRIR